MVVENKGSGRLANILTRVLRWVNSEEYEDHGNFMVFGTTYEGIRDKFFEKFCPPGAQNHVH